MEIGYKYFSEELDGNLEAIQEKSEFELYQLKLEHHHWSSGDMDIGLPVVTSIELRCNHNFETGKDEWERIVSHTYLSFKNCHEQATDSYSEKISNGDSLINEIKKYDLRDLKNNYFTNVSPERFTHWELSYNNIFKISGTYDQEIEAIAKIRELLDFNNVIEKEVNKIEIKRQELKN